MLKQPILRAIADVVDHGGDEITALTALRRVDPLLRFVARRRLRLALTGAALHAPQPADAARAPEPEDGAHVLRLAYLWVAGTPLLPTGPIDTMRAFERCRRRMRERTQGAGPGRWWLTGGLALLAVLALGCGGVLGYRALRGASSPPPDAPPPPAGAFATGGTPARGGAVIDRALGRDLPAFLIALDGWRRARGQSMPTSETALRLEELETLQDRLEVRRVRLALGAAAAHWLSRLLRLMRELAVVRRPEGLLPTYAQLVVALNDALAARGLGYYLDSELITATGDVRHVILYVFRVERVQRFVVPEANGQVVTTLHLRRLDRLNWAHGALGFTRREHREALVLLDGVDDILVTYLLPALSNARMVLADPATHRAGVRWSEEIATRAAEVIRGELVRVPGLTLAEAQRLAGLLARRRALLMAWQQVLGQRGYGIVEPTGLTLGWDYRRALRGVIGAKQLEEMARLERGLSTRVMGRTLAALRRAVAASVAHHETQHRLDYQGPVRMTLPEPLRRRLGPLVHRGRIRRRVRRARDELSAYLAELARARHWTQLDLALIARFAFDQRHAGSAEHAAARVILEGLAALCGRVGDTPHHASRSRYAQLYLYLSRQPSALLREAARRLWEDLFRTELPTLRPLVGE